MSPLDPMALPPQKAIDQIGKTLQLQYERWQHRVCVTVLVDMFHTVFGLRQSRRSNGVSQLREPRQTITELPD